MLTKFSILLFSVYVCQGADIAYDTACDAAADTCTVTGTACVDPTSSGTTKCLCDGLWEANTTPDGCVCKSGYLINTATDACLTGVGGTCTASGSECWHVTGGYCNTAAASAVCACGAAYTASGTACNGETCTTDTTCTDLDANSVCYNGNCKCKVGYMLDASGTSNKCVTAFGSGAKGVVSSMTVVIGSLLLASLYL